MRRKTGRCTLLIVFKGSMSASSKTAGPYKCRWQRRNTVRARILALMLARSKDKGKGKDKGRGRGKRQVRLAGEAGNKSVITRSPWRPWG